MFFTRKAYKERIPVQTKNIQKKMLPLQLFSNYDKKLGRRYGKIYK